MMKTSSPAVTATLRALHGDADPHVVAPALENWRFARIPALTPGGDPVIGVLGALAGALPDVLPLHMLESPALSAAVASLIETDASEHILPIWADVAPARWGASHAAALIDVGRRNRCEPWVAAALISSSATSAALVRRAEDIPHVIRHWGKTPPDDPITWMNHLASAERDWLLNALRKSPAAAVRSLPIAAIPAVVAALLALPDPIAFVQIAGGARAVPPALCDWIATIPIACGEETHALLDALPDDVRTALRPNPHVPGCRLTLRHCRTDFLQMLSPSLPCRRRSSSLPATRSTCWRRCSVSATNGMRARSRRRRCGRRVIAFWRSPCACCRISSAGSPCTGQWDAG